MAFDPREYDLDELRWISRSDEDAGFEFGHGRVLADDVLRSRLHRELSVLGEAAPGLTKPYLEVLPASYVAETLVFEWLEYLVATGGYRATADALRYYVAVGWISARAERTLDEYLRGVAERVEPRSGGFRVDDHVTSLSYVAQLASIRQGPTH